MRIIIDADACPKSVLEICMRLGKKYAVEVWTVASFAHNIQSENHIIVDSGPQEADLKIINITLKGDIVVTQDWGLASMVLGKWAKCIHPLGKEYQSQTIDFLLEEREAKAKFRRSGGRTKGPAKRLKENDIRFEKCLEKILTDSI